MLPFSLALLLISEPPSNLFAPIDRTNCPAARHELLGPQAVDSGKVPTNASLWVREDPTVAWDRFEKPLLIAPDGSTVDVEELSTPMRLGNLLELRPRAHLEPNTEYGIQTDLVSVLFTTAAAADDEPPAAPELGETKLGNRDCTGFGIDVAFTHTAAGEPMLYLAESDDQQLFNTIRGNPIFVPLAEMGENVEASVIAMDLAGNRSVPSLRFEEAGCSCSTAESERGSLLFSCAFLISLAVLFLTRRRA